MTVVYFRNIDTLKNTYVITKKFRKRKKFVMKKIYSQKMHKRLLKICTTNLLKNAYSNY